MRRRRRRRYNVGGVGLLRMTTLPGGSGAGLGAPTPPP